MRGARYPSSPVRVVRLFLAASVAVAFLAVAPEARGQAADLAEARERANRAARAVADAESEVGALESQVAEQQARFDQAEATLAALRGTMQETAVAAYIGEASAPPAQFITGADINASVQAAALARLVTQGSADSIDEYRAVREDAEAARVALDAALAAQRDAVEELRERRAALDAELSRLEAEEAARIAAEEAARRAAAAAASRSAGGGGGGAPRAAAPSTPIATGSWVCPVQGPVAFVDSWGAPRSGGRRHQGVDMMSPRGTPVVAPVDGTLTHRSNSLGGLTFYLNGVDGNRYYGAHLSGYANEGAGSVSAGTVVGYVGDSGNARGNNHLHFEIQPGGSPINPYPTVARYC